MTQLMRKSIWACGAAIAAAATAQPAQAQQRSFDVPAQPIERAIPEFARQAGVQIVAPADGMEGIRSKPLKGTMDVREGLRRLIQGSGLVISSDQGGVILLRAQGANVAAQGQSPSREATAGNIAAEAESAEDIVVTGTNIRGITPVGSPNVVLNRADIEATGYGSTERVLQSLPQNFRGGNESPSADGVNFGSGALAGLNTSFGSAANLRGLGANATVTLVNNHRLAPSSQGNFFDISLVPITAIERIEVLTDGASAIYGADAVGGVVNIRLRRNFEGAESSVRYGTTTDGAREEWRVGQTVGHGWESGGIVLSAEHLQEGELDASERKFTQNVLMPSSIYPSNKRTAFVASAHQDIGDRLTVATDVLYAYAKRRNVASSTVSTVRTVSTTDRYDAAASLAYRAFADWEMTLDGNLSHEQTDGTFSTFTPAQTFLRIGQVNAFTQDRRSVGLRANGGLFQLPAGTVRAALGVSYEDLEFISDVKINLASGASIAALTPADRNVKAAFAELYVPLLAEENGVPGVRSLELSLAVRHDDYSDVGATTNPKIGLAWVPVEGLKFQGSYGTSFRAPAIGFETAVAQLGTTALTIFSRPPPTGTGNVPVVQLRGSQPVRPEKSENWTVGAIFEPTFLPGLRLSINYFNVDYTDRIVTPPTIANVLRDPALALFVQQFSSNADLQAALAPLLNAGTRVVDATGGAFGPNPLGRALFIYDSRSQNAAFLKINGGDFSADYQFGWGQNDLQVGAQATYLGSLETVFAPGAPAIELIDTTGNPAKWRLRARGSWSRGDFGANVFLNHTSGYANTLIASEPPVDAFTTVDLSLRYDATEGPLRGLSVALSVENLFNQDPPFVGNIGRGASYDSANANPLGRLIAIELKKRW